MDWISSGLLTESSAGPGLLPLSSELFLGWCGGDFAVVLRPMMS